MENIKVRPIPVVEKRDGRLINFNPDKIKNALYLATRDCNAKITNKELDRLTLEIVYECLKNESKLSVEKIHNIVESTLVKEKYFNIASSYLAFRKDRDNTRAKKSDLMEAINKIAIETDRDNANVGNNFSSKFLRIASEASKWANLASMPKEIAKEHEIGDLYYHDLDSYNLTTNCLHLDTGTILRKGFNTGYGYISKPKRIETAAMLSCIMLQSSQNDMFGGQSHPNFDNDLSEFVGLTREEIKNKHPEYSEHEVEVELLERVHQAMQAVVYNLNTMHSRAGSQVPFSSVNIGIPKNHDAYIIAKVFLEEYYKGLGHGEQPIFPNIIFRVKDGVNKKPEDPYYDLFKYACKVASKRMNPTFMNLDADFNKKYYDMGYIPATMGCRTYLMSNVNGEPGVEGRGNIAPVTINLPRIAILAKGDIDEFFRLFNIKIDTAKKSLLHRYSVLKNLRVKDLPFVVGQNLIKGSEGLEENDSIEPILKQGTWGIGFIGLAETLIALTGKHHGESEESRKLGEKIIEFLRYKCDKFTEETSLNWSTYATPAEGLSGKFIDKDKKRFGIIKGVTDKDYYTNSFHVPVYYKLSIKDKLDIEAPYHKLCNGGHISYIEVDDNPTSDVIENILNYAYNNTNINYVGINFHIRYCKDCGQNLISSQKSCPKCGGLNIQGISRVTGYLSLDERFGKGKLAEKKDRVKLNK